MNLHHLHPNCQCKLYDLAYFYIINVTGGPIFFGINKLVNSNLVTEEISVAANFSDGNIGDLFVSVGYPKIGDIPLLNRKIFQGFHVTVQEHPYIVSIRRQYSHYVTGTLLTKTLVLTVAHPIFDVPIYELGIVAGETFSDRGTTLHSVVLLIIHEDFNPYTLAADMALLRVYEELVYKISVKPIALISPTSTLNDERVFVTGWGRCDLTGKELCLPRSTRFLPGEKIDPILRTISFVITTPNYYCDGYERHETRLGPGMLCVGQAREENAVAPCLAVPGAALVANARLVGLQSWGFGCGYQNDLPLVYTDIRFYQPWILHNVPILRKVTQNNLTEIFQVMTAFSLSKWLSLTRGNSEPLKITQYLTKIPQRNLDVVLAKLKGNIFDIRDFIFSGEFRESKKAMFESIRIDLQNSLKNKTASLQKVITTKPFLDKYKLENEEYSIVKYEPNTENLTDTEERYDNFVNMNVFDINSEDEIKDGNGEN